MIALLAGLAGLVFPSCRVQLRSYPAPKMTLSEQQAGEQEEISKQWDGANPLTDEELKEIFYRSDADLSGEVDKDELAAALFSVGYKIDREEYGRIWDEADTDGGGTISFEEFLNFVRNSQRRSYESQRFAMELFNRYDIDRGGTIDPWEFAGLAEEVEQNYKRRSILTGAAALVGGLIVAKYTDEYLFAQKALRGLYIEKEAELAQNKYFPTALLSSDLDDAVARTLGGRGFTPRNTLFGHSVCSDEVNNKNEEMVHLMVDRWGEGFSLGGLGGLPFAGKSGFRAYLHHCPDNGKLLVMFAPHVGIDALGRIGALQRDGQDKISKACGAALGSYKAIQSTGEVAAPASSVKDIGMQDYNQFDPQLQTIIGLLKPRLKRVNDAEEPIAFVTYQMYTIVRDLLDNCIKETPDVWEWASEYAIVGGIMVNRRTGGDFFQPLDFVLHRPGDTPPVDLFEQAFGPKPNLLPVLGSEEAAKAVLERGATTAALFDSQLSIPKLNKNPGS